VRTFCVSRPKQADDGSVDYYDTTTGALTTRHEYRSSSHVAKVNIDHVREGLPSITTAVGSWVNVVGYVQEHTASETRVQATMLWDAGAVKLEDYERALQARKDATARK
jgi:hypothetical protein